MRTWLRLIAAAPDLLEACRAALKYDKAISLRGVDGRVSIDARGGIAEGADLDALYFDWIVKAETAVAKAEGQ